MKLGTWLNGSQHETVRCDEDDCAYTYAYISPHGSILWTLQTDIQCWLESPKILPDTVELFPPLFSCWERCNFSKRSGLLPGWFCSSLTNWDLRVGKTSSFITGPFFFLLLAAITCYSRLYTMPIPLIPSERFSFQVSFMNCHIQFWDFLWKKRKEK